MSREKQIEEMARVIHKADENCSEYFPISMSECLGKHGRFRTNAAVELYNAGYQKQSEVAREIFEEIDKVIKEHSQGYCCDWYLYELIAELKKKYTEGGA